MKKIRLLSFLLVLCMSVGMLSGVSFAAEVVASGTCGENLTWTLDDAGTLTISGTGAMENYGVGTARWYSSSSKIKHVVIENGVTTIGSYAFYSCDSLTSVEIGGSVTVIGEGAFCYCESLTSITIPDSVTIIGGDAFYGCDSLTSVEIGSSVTNIGAGAFSRCESLTSITIPDSVTTIGEEAFYYCRSLTSVEIGNSVTTIGDSAFFYCALTSVEIPNSVITIGGGAFSTCLSLTSITIPDSVTTIGEEAFCYCESLTSVEIGDSVTTIGDSAFWGCDSLASVEIGDSVTTIGNYTFFSCISLTSITVDPKNLNYSSLDGVLYNKDQTVLIRYAGGKNATSFEIPDSVITIGNDAFSNCDSLTSVTIPGSVTTIGREAFSGCESLPSITIPGSVTTIGDYAFYSCDSLTDVYYTGSEAEWAAIWIGSDNDPLISAAIHYNYRGSASYTDGNNDNDAGAVAANWQKGLPTGINDAITVNYSGNGYAYFVLQDESGNPYQNRSVRYKFTDDDNTLYSTQTNANGVVAVATARLTTSDGTAQTYTKTVVFSNEDLLENTFTFDVTVTPPEYSQSWEGAVSFGASLTAKNGVFGLGISSANEKNIAVEEIIKQDGRDLKLSSDTDRDLAATGSIGLDIGPVTLAEVSGEVGLENRLGKGYYLEDYDPNDASQRLKIEVFLLDTALGLDDSNVIPRMLFNYWMERNGLPTSNEENQKIGIKMEAGASVGGVEAGGFATELAGVNAEGKFSWSTKHSYDNKQTTSTSTEFAFGYNLINSKYKQTSNSGTSISTGGALWAETLVNNSITFSATSEDDDLQKISFKSLEESKNQSVGNITQRTQYTKTISYTGETAKQVADKNDFMRGIGYGEFGFFTVGRARSTADEMLKAESAGTIEREKEYAEVFTRKLNIGPSDDLSVKLGISGTYAYNYTAETGVIKDSVTYIQSSNQLDTYIRNNGNDFGDIIDPIVEGINADFQSCITQIKGAVKEGVNWLKAKITGAVDWTVNLFTFDRTKVTQHAFVIMSVDETEAASVATTVGDPYVVAVSDEDGTPITDFGDNDIDLSLYFDETDFAVSGISYTDEMIAQLKLYRWDEERAVYVAEESVVDSANACVTASISCAGQYILAIDNGAPSVGDFKVSASNATPTITATVADMSGISNFSFTLDGEELVNDANLSEYYNANTGAFSYAVTAPLSDGEHTAAILASDSAGNAMAAPIELVFTVDDAAPTITFVGVPEFTMDETVTVTAQAEDDNLSSLNAEVEYDGIKVSFPMTETDGVWSAEIEGLPKFARFDVTVHAYDSVGNHTASEAQSALIAKRGEDAVYLGVPDYTNKTAEVLINNTTSEAVTANLILKGYDESGTLIETRTQEVTVEPGYDIVNVVMGNHYYKIRAELVDAGGNALSVGFSAYSTEGVLADVSVSTINGAQIRTSGNQGLRFISSIDTTAVDFDRVVEFGTILIPSADITDVSELVIGATLNGHTVARVPAENLYAVTDSAITFTAVITNIAEKNYAREYTARAYAILDDGSVVYSDSGASRSIYTVAKRGLESATESEANKAIFQAIVDAVENA